MRPPIRKHPLSTKGHRSSKRRRRNPTQIRPMRPQTRSTRRITRRVKDPQQQDHGTGKPRTPRTQRPHRRRTFTRHLRPQYQLSRRRTKGKVRKQLNPLHHQPYSRNQHPERKILRQKQCHQSHQVTYKRNIKNLTLNPAYIPSQEYLQYQGPRQ